MNKRSSAHLPGNLFQHNFTNTIKFLLKNSNVLNLHCKKTKIQWQCISYSTFFRDFQNKNGWEKMSLSRQLNPVTIPALKMVLNRLWHPLIIVIINNVCKLYKWLWFLYFIFITLLAEYLVKLSDIYPQNILFLQGVRNRRKIKMTLFALPHDYTCFADGTPFKYSE